MRTFFSQSGAWAMLPTAFGEFVEHIKANGAQQPRNALPLRPDETFWGDPIAKPYQLNEATIIPIHGALVSGSSPSDKAFGGIVDYADLQADIKNACTRSQSIILDIQSPGGMCQGMEETCSLIGEECGVRDIHAFIGGLGCSAAYALAANCSSIWCAPSSTVGSVGTILSIPILSRMWDAMGVDWKVFTSGEMKAIGNQNQPMPVEHEVELQSYIEDIGNAFRAMVMERRPSVDSSNLEGQFFTGSKAVSLGFADSLVPSLDELLETLYGDSDEE